MSQPTVDEVANAMFDLVKSTYGKKNLKPMDVTKALIEQFPQIGNVDLVTMPHHGSRSSSTEDFVKFLRADHVVATAGWKNHFGHPKPDVAARWLSTGAMLHETAVSGALSLVANPGQGYRLAAHRETDRRFWHR